MKYLQDIKMKLIVEMAANLSDAEINRILTPCVCGHWLVPLAKDYRDNGILIFEDLKDAIKKQKASY